MKNIALFSIILASTVACSSSKVDPARPEPVSAAKPTPPTPTPQSVTDTTVAGGPEKDKAKPAIRPTSGAGGFKGLPWRACSGLGGNAMCKESIFRTTPLGMMTDGTAGVGGAGTQYIYTTSACEGNTFCRAYLANGNQCKNGDTVACEAWTYTGGTGGSGGTGFGGGTSTCNNGTWSPCQ